jgi:type IV secretory pathway TraG/TraD family ATPase VirD4
MSERIASSIIPDCPGRFNTNDKFWRDGAREVFTAILNYLRLEDMKNNNCVYNMLSLSPAELSSRLKSHETCINALNFITPPDSPQAGGIMATLTQFTKFFKYLKDIEDTGFSIPAWLKSVNGSTIFVTNNAGVQDILKPVLTLFIDLISSSILTLPDNSGQKLYLFIDELGTLHPLISLINLLTYGRSKGTSIWLAVQDFSQIDNIYGENLRKTILNSCTTHIYFSVADNFTAETISRLIGEQEVLEQSKTSGLSSPASVTASRKKKSVLMPSEIMQMKPFNYIFRGNIHPPFFNLIDPEDFKSFPDISEPFIIR